MIAAPRVLVVEDNPLTSKMLRITLETEGYAAEQAFDGREALATAARCMPDLVLQDLVLPDMSGFELVRQLRALPRGSEIPIVALSGFMGRIDEARASEAAFTSVLVKPIDPSRLIDCVRSYCPIRRAPVASSVRGRSLLIVDDDPVQLKLLRIHFEQQGYDIRTASSALEALRLARANTPDIIVSDVLMPNVDGFQLCLEARRDPRLAATPVVLLSAWYQTEADRDLARRVGASAFVLRTPDFEELGAKIQQTFQSAPPTTDEPTDHLKLEHAKAVIRQLESQLAVSSGLLRRCTLQASQISLLSGVADALARKTNTDVVLRDVLAATLDGAGISKGALFLRDADSALLLRQSIGFSKEEVEGLRDWFGGVAVIEEIVARGAAISVASSAFPEATRQLILRGADVASAEIVPLIVEGRSVGVLLLAAKCTDLTSDDAVAFARAMGNQLAQSLELASSFARLASSEHRYRVLTESAHDAICTLSPEGAIRDGNGRLESVLGLSKHQIIGRNIADFAGPGAKNEFLEGYRKAVATGAGRTAPVEIQRSGGEIVLVEFSVAALEVGEERLVFAIGRDVTEQVRTQAQLLVSDRMASIGALAAGVAHEINNPLTTVVANLELAARDVGRLAKKFSASEDVEELESEIRDAREGAERVREIVRDLRIFSRSEEERRGPVDVHRVLDSSLRMATNETRHRAQVVKDYGEVPPVLANESRLGQVFVNLIVNAAQAIQEGHADSNEIRIRTRVAGAERVVVEIADTGHGMSPDVLKRLFTPFFTTKEIGVGTGLGLAISHRIIATMGGDMEVESVEGKGTTFRLTLPVADGEEAFPSVPVAAAAQRRGKVLVVDDELSVGRTIGRMLSEEHDVEATTSAAEALDRIARGERFDVILCDLMMPVMTGMDLHERLERAGTGYADRMVFLTGGAFTPRARAFFDRVPNARLEKPFALQTLRALVNERLR
jgi:PAS domain S-box-containing protein